ncbi:MAG TPA: SH3 domain-containing protein [Chloroflexia bacterium]|nr:SH3 domain-containing protein [Chloroflexia bacterium]
MGLTSTVLAATPVMVGGTALVTNTDGDPIRVREGASVEFTPVTVAWEGEEVTVLAGPLTDKTGIRWFKVQARGGTGWMMAQYLQGASKTQARFKSGSVAHVANTNGDMLRVRSAPNTGGRIVTRLNPGAKVTIRSGPVTDKATITWYEVTASGFTGWAMSQYLALAPEAPVPSPTRKPTAETDRVTPTRPAAPATPTPGPPPAGATSTKAQYRQWMGEARTMYPYRESIDKMWSVMMCESGGNPGASGGGGAWLGLFQYAPSTWRGSWNPYRNSSIWDAKSQIFATAKAWSIGMQRAWTCY